MLKCVVLVLGRKPTPRIPENGRWEELASGQLLQLNPEKNTQCVYELQQVFLHVTSEHPEFQKRNPACCFAPRKPYKPAFNTC